MDRVVADTEGSEMDVMVEEAAVEDGVEDEGHLRRRRKSTTYPNS